MKGFKSLGCLLVLLLAAIILLPSKAMAEEIVIDQYHFNDEAFREYITEKFDTNKDGILSESELNAVERIFIYEEDIYSLGGIQYFPNLYDLTFCYTDVEELDVSKNTNLMYLNCSCNKLRTLDISKNTKLISLGCAGNDLTKLNVSKHPDLEHLTCVNNRIAKLDVSKNTKLKELDCSHNELEALDVSANINLIDLNVCVNEDLKLTGLSKLTKLIVLDCSECGLTSLDIKANKKLECLYCDGNKIDQLAINLAPALVTAYTSEESRLIKGKTSTLYRYSFNDDDDCYEIEVDNTTKVITAKPAISTQPKSQTIVPGKKVTFKVAAKGVGLSYQWQYKKPGATSWTNVSSSAGKKASYSFTVAARHYKYQYRCKVSNVAGYKYSKAATLTVKTKPVITSPTKATTKTVKKGATVKLTVKANAAETYQWQYKKPGSTKWLNFKTDAGKKASYSFKATLTKKGYQYRCKVTNPYGTTISKTFTLKVTS